MHPHTTDRPLQVTTEGDSFIVSFHHALDATAWALHVQYALMKAAWPQELLCHPKACVVTSSETDGSRPGAVIFRGLRVRVGINTGKCGNTVTRCS